MKNNNSGSSEKGNVAALFQVVAVIIITLLFGAWLSGAISYVPKNHVGVRSPEYYVP